jgi:hypothetical protein
MLERVTRRMGKLSEREAAEFVVPALPKWYEYYDDQVTGNEMSLVYNTH